MFDGEGGGEGGGASAAEDRARPLTLSELDHWLEFGGTCRRVSVGSDRAIVDLCTCTGELVERREAFEPPVLERLVRLRDQPED